VYGATTKQFAGAYAEYAVPSAGMMAPLNYSVFSAAGGALLLGACEDSPFGLDALLRRKKQGTSQGMK